MADGLRRRARFDSHPPRRPRNAAPRTRREEPTFGFDQSLDAPAFAGLGLPRPLTSALANLGIEEPFPIQAATIPDILQGRDVLGRGRTGSGKTLAFGLPMLTRLMGASSQNRRPRGLVLVPTRELAMQVRDSLMPLAQQAHLGMQLVIGGASYQRQMEGLARGADIVVATPGRLIDLVERRACDLGDVTIAVLDEADQMCDMGFFEDVDHLMGLVHPEAQRLLFSATLDGDVQRLVSAHLTDPIEHATDPGTASVATMTHHLFVVDAREKPEIVHAIARREGRTICFARTQLGVEQWAGELQDQGVRVEALHGGKSQASRAKAIDNFKQGRVDVLVATDVAARGIHVDDVDLVLQIDPPRDPKDYLHRAGRTARAGKEGLVVLIATTRQIRGVERMLTDAGVEALDRRIHAGDPALAEIAGARDEVAPRRAPARLREERAVQRAVREAHDDGLSDVDHREARPRTAPFDDRRARQHRDDRRPADARRFEREQGRPRFSARREDERPAWEGRTDARGGGRDRADRPWRDERSTWGDRRPSERPREDRRDGWRGDSRDDSRSPRPYGRGDSARPARDERWQGAPRRDRWQDDRRDNRPRDDRGPARARDDRGTGRSWDAPARSDRGPRRTWDAPAGDDRRRDAGDRPRAGAPRRPGAPTGGPKSAASDRRTDKPRWTAKDRKSRTTRGK